MRSSLLIDDEVTIESTITPTAGNEDWHVRLTIHVDDAIVESSPIAFLYSLGALSFDDARPRGVSGNWFEDGDHFTLEDAIQHTRFERGRLVMYVDYLRGRCLKTTVEIASDGTIVLDTVNRGKAAPLWIERLRGKKRLAVVPGDAADDATPEGG